MYQYRHIIYKKRLKERCINNAGKTMDIYKCINIDTSFIQKTKGEMYK